MDRKTEKKYEVSAEYSSLRDRVLKLERGDLGQPSTKASAVLAVLMETGHPKAVITLVATADGSTSLYFSNGGGLIGAGENPEVALVAEKFVTGGALYFGGAFSPKPVLSADSAILPELGEVRFYFVTESGIYSAKGSEEKLGLNRHPFSKLFHLGHELIEAIGEHSG